MTVCIFDRSIRGLAAIAVLLVALPAASAEQTVVVGGHTFVNKGLVGVGRIPAGRRDQFGETVGSASGLAADVKSWRRSGNTYRGTFYMLPDRGYNVNGTTDFRARIYKLSITFTPVAESTTLAADGRQKSVVARMTQTILLKDAKGKPLTGLDPGAGVRAPAGGFPPLPQASTGAVSLDSEAIVRMPDGSFFISDEYGPYIYRFSRQGKLLSAIRPPEAFIPKRGGVDNFSSNNSGPGATEPKPPNPETGRQNNQGFEGLARTPNGKFLVAILQSALRQDAGASPESRQNTRMVYYDISDPRNPKLAREHMVPLPTYASVDGKTRVAAQSELYALDETHFLLLCRDGGAGYGMENTSSRYRNIEILDTSQATNLAGTKYDGLVPVAPDGRLEEGIAPATLTNFIDINDNAQLERFGLHNGEPNDRNNLSEKWEGMTIVPALDPANRSDVFLFVSNDNDFMTQNGFQVGASYKDERGVDVDTMFLVYRLTLPQFPR